VLRCETSRAENVFLVLRLAGQIKSRCFANWKCDFRKHAVKRLDAPEPVRLERFHSSVEVTASTCRADSRVESEGDAPT
jgi:hypothetical protein